MRPATSSAGTRSTPSRRTASNAWSRTIWWTRVIGSSSRSAMSGSVSQSAGSMGLSVTASICHAGRRPHHRRAQHVTGVRAHRAGVWQPSTDRRTVSFTARLPYLVMEYVRGRTLREVLGERHRLGPQEALAILEQILAAISAAHRAGLVHRDVKPENVLVAEAPTASVNSLVDGVVKVADFGLARAVEASVDDGAGDRLMATVAYVAPELVTDGHTDPRADVYSAGVVLFEMLTGRVPYTADRPVDVAWQHVDRDMPVPSRYAPGVPPVVDQLVVRATRRDPGARPTDAGAMLAEVQAAREEIGLSVTSQARGTAPPTVVVPHLAGARPAWARLPGGSRGWQRQRRSTGWWHDLVDRVNAHPHGRTAVAAALVAFGLIVAVGGWWFGIGRYTEAPDLRNRTRAQAEAQAKQGGFTIRIGAGRFDENVPKDTVLDQRPGAGQRIVTGGTITLTLSLGPDRVPVPGIVGVSFDLARQQLERLRL